MPGLGDLERNVAKLEKANEEMRELIREAHEVNKTTKLLTKELREEREIWKEGIKEVVDAALARQVKAGLALFEDDLRKATMVSYDNVQKNFEELTNLMMYGNKKGKGETNIIEDWIEKKIQMAIRQIGR